MPPSSKRRTRQRAAELHDMSDADVADSSPSRPAAKKRRTNAATTPTPVKNDSTLESELVKEEDDPSDEDDLAESQEIVDSVIPSLAVAKDSVSVAIDHANTFIEKEYKDGVQAYAKLAGREWTYYVKTLSVNIGRPPDTMSRQSVEVGAQSSPFPDHEDTTKIHIDLGPSKVISRLHAELFFDMKDGKWHIIVNGRNGLKVNEMTVRRGQRTSLSSGDVIEIGGTQMMFVLPGEKAVIHHIFIDRAQALANGEEPDKWNNQVPHAHPESTAYAPRPESSQGFPINSRGNLGHVPLAPAPPDYKRHSTPASPRVPDAGNRPKQSPSYNRGFMLESTEDIDYSLDSAKDLKPPFSYATLISQAILSSSEEKLTLASIYQWIQEQYAFYRHSSSGWQNSIRHNLSLSKAFQKIPRRTDEPGKGMKWQIVPEHRHEFNNRGPRNTKGGARGSSAPNSPAARDNARTFGPLSHQTGALEQNQEGIPLSSQLKHSPRSTTPPMSSYPVAAKEAYTPERGSHLPHQLTHGPPQVFDDASPLPPRSKNAVYGFSDAAAAGSPPLLSSSAYYDETRSLVTPAPRRQNPKLAPPSTAHLPSTYMPTSSPAPFWKFADDGSTPARPMPDLSPLKTGGTNVMGGLHSSSPPAASGSPSRPRSGPFTNAGIPQIQMGNGLAAHEEDEETEGIDLARGFQPIGSFHKQMTNGTIGR